MNLRRRKALTSRGVRSNHSPFLRFDSNRLCQYASMPTGSSVRISCTLLARSGSWMASSYSRRPEELLLPILIVAAGFDEVDEAELLFGWYRFSGCPTFNRCWARRENILEAFIGSTILSNSTNKLIF